MQALAQQIIAIWEALECDVRLFWKIVKRQYPVNYKTYQENILDGKLFDCPAEITRGFATYFENIYNPRHSASFDHEFSNSVEKSYKTIKETDRRLSLNYPLHSKEEQLQPTRSPTSFANSISGRHRGLIVLKTTTYIWKAISFKGYLAFLQRNCLNRTKSIFLEERSDYIYLQKRQ